MKQTDQLLSQLRRASKKTYFTRINLTQKNQLMV